MKRLAAMPNVFMKISKHGCTEKVWLNENGEQSKNAKQVIAKSVELIKLFTPKRCMFATNYPVDYGGLVGAWDMNSLFNLFNEIANNFPPED